MAGSVGAGEGKGVEIQDKDDIVLDAAESDAKVDFKVTLVVEAASGDDAGKKAKEEDGGKEDKG